MRKCNTLLILGSFRFYNVQMVFILMFQNIKSQLLEMSPLVISYCKSACLCNKIHCTHAQMFLFYSIKNP